MSVIFSRRATFGCIKSFQVFVLQRNNFCWSPCLLADKTSMKVPVSPEKMSKNVPAKKRKTTEVSGLKNNTAYPFMSAVQKDRFTYSDSFGYEERWKYEIHVITVCVIIFVVYFSYLRKETGVDQVLKNPPGIEEVQVKLAVSIARSIGNDTTKLEKQLEDIQKEKLNKEQANNPAKPEVKA